PKSEAGSSAMASIFLPSTPPFALISAIAICSTSCSDFSLIAMKPLSEWRMPTLMVPPPPSPSVFPPPPPLATPDLPVLPVPPAQPARAEADRNKPAAPDFRSISRRVIRDDGASDEFFFNGESSRVFAHDERGESARPDERTRWSKRNAVLLQLRV